MTRSSSTQILLISLAFLTRHSSAQGFLFGFFKSLRGGVAETIENARRHANCPDGLPNGVNAIFLGSVSSGTTTVTIDTLSSSSGDTEIAVWDQNGDLLAENDNAYGATTLSEISSLLLTPGDYVVGGAEAGVSFGEDFAISNVAQSSSMELVMTISDINSGETVSDSVILDDGAIFVCFSVDSVTDGTVDGTASFVQTVYAFLLRDFFTALSKLCFFCVL